MNESIYRLGRLAIKRSKKKPLSDELYHFGILGMKWGKRNGPPYPLDYSQLSRDERDRAKGRAKREGNLDEASRNRMYFSDQELRDVVNRFKLNKEVDQLLSEGNISKGEKRVKKLTKTFRNISDMMNALQSGTQNTINLYNKLRTVEARYMGEDFTPINTATGNKSAETLAKEKADKKDEAKHSLEMSDELYHFGILGMKWGKRNGPPYPLDSSISTGKRLKVENKGTKSHKINADESYDGFSIVKTEGDTITAKGEKGPLSNRVIRIRNVNNIHGEELIKLQKICRDFPEDKARDILARDQYDNNESIQSKFTREEFKKKYTVGGLDVFGPSEKNKTTSLIFPMNPVEDYIKDADYSNSPFGDMNFEIHTDLDLNKPKTYS